MTTTLGPRDRVMTELRRVAKALAEMGGSGTAAEVAAACGWAAHRTARRLASGGLAAPGKVTRFFACDKPHGRTRPGVWSLTAAGVELVNAGREPADKE